MRKLTFLISTLIFSFLGNAQRISDSVIVYIDNRLEMTIVVDDYHDLRSNHTIEPMILKFQKVLKVMEDRLDPDQAEIIRYTKDSIATVEQAVNSEIFLINGDEINATGVRDQAIISSQGVKIILTTKDISNISEEALILCAKQVFERLPEKSAVAQSLYYQCINNAVTEIADKNKYHSYGDAIELSMGVGANLLKNKWMGEITFATGVWLNKKGYLKHNPYVSANLLYDFPGKGRMNINTFLNVGYRWNRAKSDEKEKPFGVELGYLISREGDFFGENTFRLGVNAEISRSITINPQLYMEDNFKRMYPGIKIGFGF